MAWLGFKNAIIHLDWAEYHWLTYNVDNVMYLPLMRLLPPRTTTLFCCSCLPFSRLVVYNNGINGPQDCSNHLSRRCIKGVSAFSTLPRDPVIFWKEFLAFLVTRDHFQFTGLPTSSWQCWERKGSTLWLLTLFLMTMNVLPSITYRSIESEACAKFERNREKYFLVFNAKWIKVVG